MRSGLIEIPVIVEAPERTKLSDALEKYTDYIQYHRSPRTFRTYRPILKSFGEFCNHTYVDEIDRATVMEFATHQHGRTKILNASDWPSFVQTVRPIYEDSELVKLFKACTPSEDIRFKSYLMSGFRDAEGRFTTWRDVYFRHTAVRVTAKPHWGFSPKTWEEREVPVPQRLIALLEKFRPTGVSPDDPIFQSAKEPYAFAGLWRNGECEERYT